MITLSHAHLLPVVTIQYPYENEEINLCLMAKSYESDEEVTSSNNLSISFDELQDAFADLHKESIKLAKLVSSSKKTITNSKTSM